MVRTLYDPYPILSPTSRRKAIEKTIGKSADTCVAGRSIYLFVHMFERTGTKIRIYGFGLAIMITCTPQREFDIFNFIKEETIP
jgi:hypothetical protein